MLDNKTMFLYTCAMQPNSFPAEVQKKIREYYRAQPRGIYSAVARDLGIEQRAVSYSIAPNSIRPMTFEFLGRLVLYRPDDWRAIREQV